MRLSVLKHIFVSLWVILFLTAMASFCAAQLQKVTLSYSSSGITSIEFFIAKEKKFFQEEGLEPLLIQMSANTAIAAGVTGELTGLSSVGSAIRGIQRAYHVQAMIDRPSRTVFSLSIPGTSYRATFIVSLRDEDDALAASYKKIKK